MEVSTDQRLVHRVLVGLLPSVTRSTGWPGSRAGDAVKTGLTRSGGDCSPEGEEGATDAKDTPTVPG